MLLPGCSWQLVLSCSGVGDTSRARAKHNRGIVANDKELLDETARLRVKEKGKTELSPSGAEKE